LLPIMFTRDGTFTNLTSGIDKLKKTWRYKQPSGHALRPQVYDQTLSSIAYIHHNLQNPIIALHLIPSSLHCIISYACALSLRPVHSVRIHHHHRHPQPSFVCYALSRISAWLFLTRVPGEESQNPCWLHFGGRMPRDL
jgi:hypothetical protein